MKIKFSDGTVVMPSGYSAVVGTVSLDVVPLTNPSEINSFFAGFKPGDYADRYSGIFHESRYQFSMDKTDCPDLGEGITPIGTMSGFNMLNHCIDRMHFWANQSGQLLVGWDSSGW